ncbi:hypothetical protein STENM223S_00076 [Streptomyces tendae]
MPRLLRELRLGDDLLGLDEDDPGARCVVGGVLTGHPNAAGRRDRERAPQRCFEVLACHAARPQDARDLAGGVDDGRLDADLAGAAVQHEVNGSTQLGTDVVRRGGADRAETVGRRRRDTAAEGRQQREGDGMVGYANGHGFQATRRFEGHAVTAPQDQRERSWPEAFGQQARRRGHVLDPAVQVSRVADVDDQGVGGRAPLDLEDAGDSGGILRVGPQTVNGFGREGHQAAGAQHLGRLLDITGSCHHSRDSPTAPLPGSPRPRSGLLSGRCVRRRSWLPPDELLVMLLRSLDSSRLEAPTTPAAADRIARTARRHTRSWRPCGTHRARRRRRGCCRGAARRTRRVARTSGRPVAPACGGAGPALPDPGGDRRTGNGHRTAGAPCWCRRCWGRPYAGGGVPGGAGRISVP